jgi:hypothetical protein
MVRVQRNLALPGNVDINHMVWDRVQRNLVLSGNVDKKHMALHQMHIYCRHVKYSRNL